MFSVNGSSGSVGGPGEALDVSGEDVGRPRGEMRRQEAGARDQPALHVPF